MHKTGLSINLYRMQNAWLLKALVIGRGRYGLWVGTRRLPLICLHRLALAGRATIHDETDPAGHDAIGERESATVDSVRQERARKFRQVLEFVFPAPGAGLSLPTELLPWFVKRLVELP